MKTLIRRCLTRNRVFFIDALGAVLSAAMLGIVLPRFTPVFGMPVYVLYPLAAAAACFAFYSLACQLLKPNRWQIFLRIVASLNLAYCLISMTLMYFFWGSLTVWGVFYFLLEKIVVLLLAYGEFEISRDEIRR